MQDYWYIENFNLRVCEFSKTGLRPVAKNATPRPHELTTKINTLAKYLYRLPLLVIECKMPILF